MEQNANVEEIDNQNQLVEQPANTTLQQKDDEQQQQKVDDEATKDQQEQPVAKPPNRRFLLITYLIYAFLHNLDNYTDIAYIATSQFVE